MNSNFMEVARTLSLQSKSNKHHVGCVLVKDKCIIASGVNGTPKGYVDNDCEDYVIKCTRCKEQLRINDMEIIDKTGKDTETMYRDRHHCLQDKMSINDFTAYYIYRNKYLASEDHYLHAEENMIGNIIMNNVKINDSTIYTTIAPSKRYSRILVTMGITKIYYEKENSDMSSIPLLKKLGVICEQI